MRLPFKQTKSAALAVAALALLLGGVGRARASSIFVTGNSALFNVNITNDPSGGNFSGTAPLNGGPTLIDNGLLNVSESITPVNASTAWIQFTFSTTNNAPLVGNPNGFWEIEASGYQLTKPATLIDIYSTFLDASGASHPHLFLGDTISPTDPNPGGVTGPVDETPPELPPYTYRTSHSEFWALDPFDQPSTNFENGGPIPTTFVMGGEYMLQPSPEPSSLTLLAFGGVALLGCAGLRRRRKAAPAS